MADSHKYIIVDMNNVKKVSPTVDIKSWPDIVLMTAIRNVQRAHAEASQYINILNAEVNRRADLQDAKAAEVKTEMPGL